MTNPVIDGCYVYAYLDPTKPAFSRGNWGFSHEPFYIGKGTNTRFKMKKNRLVQNRISELKQNNHDPIIVILPFEENHTKAYQFEKELITTFGTVKTGNGPLLNLMNGATVFEASEPWNKGYTKKHFPSMSRPGMTKRNSGTWKITHPDNSTTLITNLKVFCSENNLHYRHFLYLLKINRKLNGFTAERLK